jgi:hypothetical protein
MNAEIVYLSSDAERIANAERLGLDPDYELVSLPFPAIRRPPAGSVP